MFMPKTWTERSRERKKTVLKLKRQPKTAAERNREYRARKKYLKNASNQQHLTTEESSPSVSIHDNESIVNQTPSHQTLEDNPVHVLENQHSVLYEYLNRQSNLHEQQVEGDHRQIVVQVHQQELPLLSGNPSTTTGQQIQSTGQNMTSRRSKKIAKSPAERCREYRARQNASKNTANVEHFMCDTSTNSQDDGIVLLPDGSLHISTIEMPKIWTKRSQEYRERSKTVPKVKKPPKTAAERTREYRLRIKSLQNDANQNQMTAESSASVLIHDNESIVNQTPSHQTLEDNPVPVLENQHLVLYEYLSRQSSHHKQQVEDNHQQVEIQVHQQDLPWLSGNPSTSTGQIQSTNPNVTKLRRSKKIAKTPAERCREYRARLNASKNTSHAQRFMCDTSTNSQNDDIIMTWKERSRERRERRKTVPKVKKPPKTAAERAREYRARKRATKNAIKRKSTSESSSSIQFSDNCVINRETTLLNQQLATQHNSPTSSVVINSAINVQTTESCVPYSKYLHHNKANHELKTKSIDDSYGHICSVCERLWFKANLKCPGPEHEEILTKILPDKSMDEILVCDTCMASLMKKEIPMWSTYNGFKYPQIPTHLPPLSGHIIMDKSASGGACFTNVGNTEESKEIETVFIKQEPYYEEENNDITNEDADVKSDIVLSCYTNLQISTMDLVTVNPKGSLLKTVKEERDYTEILLDPVTDN